MIRRILFCFGAFFLGVGPATASPPEWSQPIAPFHVAGPVWYVGTKGLGVYAIVTRDGAILVSASLAKDAGQIERNLATIGVRPGQLKWIVNSHAHFDHAAGLAELRRWSGAGLVSSAGDAGALRRGRHEADNAYGHTRFPPVPVDRIVRDGEQVRLGPLALTAILTPGHTPGCTTWTLPVSDGERVLHIVFPCSITVAGNRLYGNRAYPGIVGDYRRSFARLAALPADIVLPMHPEVADMRARASRRAAGDRAAFVDRAALGRIVAGGRRAFAADLAEQRAR